jgi:transcriptional regulator of NAD metabolism
MPTTTHQSRIATEASATEAPAATTPAATAAGPSVERPAARLSTAERRERIRRDLADGACIAGDAFAHELGVSRQVIVQDIAVLRAGGLDIVATVRGYLLAPTSAAETAPRRVVAVQHGPSDTERELTALVDVGVRVLDVVVEHPVYGELRADLDLRSRRDVQLWLGQCRETGARFLSELTDGHHVHTLEADHEPILDAAEDALRTLGFLVERGA